MVDAIKILGSLLGNGALSSGSGNSVLGSLVTSALGSALGGGQQRGGAADILGGLLGGNQTSTQGGGLTGMLGGLLGGESQQHTNQSGGLNDMLGGLLGGNQQNTRNQGGGLMDMLGGMMGGNQNAAQGGGMLGSLLNGGQTSPNSAALGDLLNGALAKYGQAHASGAQLDNTQVLPENVDSNEAERQALLLVRAMINAAKADRNIDAQERENILSKTQDLSAEEQSFIRDELESPLDVQSFINQVPRGMEQQIYTVSLMAIDLDTRAEASYLDDLAQGFNLSPQTCNELHEQVGVPKLYS